MTVAAAVHSTTVRFGGVTALKDVSIEVEADQIRGLIGPNGAGKSTLVNVIAGVHRSRVGTVHYMGDDVSRLGPEARARLGLARTFQAPTLFTTLTLGENFELARRFRSRIGIETDAEQGRWLDGLVEEYQLGKWLDVVCGHAPYPVQKLADSVRALLVAPAVLVVDEPAAGLTVDDRERVRKLLISARDVLHSAILVIDHDVSLMFALSDAMTVLNGGNIIAEGAPSEIAKHPDVITAYLGTSL